MEEINAEIAVGVLSAWGVSERGTKQLCSKWGPKVEGVANTTTLSNRKKILSRYPKKIYLLPATAKAKFKIDLSAINFPPPSPR